MTNTIALDILASRMVVRDLTMQILRNLSSVTSGADWDVLKNIVSTTTDTSIVNPLTYTSDLGEIALRYRRYMAELLSSTTYTTVAEVPDTVLDRVRSDTGVDDTLFSIAYGMSGLVAGQLDILRNTVPDECARLTTIITSKIATADDDRDYFEVVPFDWGLIGPNADRIDGRYLPIVKTTCAEALNVFLSDKCSPIYNDALLFKIHNVLRNVRECAKKFTNNNTDDKFVLDRMFGEDILVKYGLSQEEASPLISLYRDDKGEFGLFINRLVGLLSGVDTFNTNNVGAAIAEDMIVLDKVTQFMNNVSAQKDHPLLTELTASVRELLIYVYGLAHNVRTCYYTDTFIYGFSGDRKIYVNASLYDANNDKVSVQNYVRHSIANDLFVPRLGISQRSFAEKRSLIDSETADTRARIIDEQKNLEYEAYVNAIVSTLNEWYATYFVRYPGGPGDTDIVTEIHTSFVDSVAASLSRSSLEEIVTLYLVSVIGRNQMMLDLYNLINSKFTELTKPSETDEESRNSQITIDRPQVDTAISSAVAELVIRHIAKVHMIQRGSSTY